MVAWIFERSRRLVRIPTAMVLLAPFAVAAAMLIARLAS